MKYIMYSVLLRRAKLSQRKFFFQEFAFKHITENVDFEVDIICQSPMPIVVFYKSCWDLTQEFGSSLECVNETFN